MATATFDDILTAQRETNALLGKQRSPLDGRTGAGKALLEAQRETTLSQRETTLSLDKVSDSVTASVSQQEEEGDKDEKSVSQQEERDKNEKSEQDNRFKKLGDVLKKPLLKVVDGIKGLNTAAKGGLFAALTAAGFLALAEFLESDTWKNIRKAIVEDLPPLLDKLYNNVIKPVIDFFLPKFQKFFGDLLGFLEEPSWGSFGNLIMDNKIAIVALAALLAPGLLLKGLRLGVTAFKLAANNLGPAFTLLGKSLKGVKKGILSLDKMARKDQGFLGLKGMAKGLGGLGSSLKAGGALIGGKILAAGIAIKGAIVAFAASASALLVPLLVATGVVAGIVTVFAALKDAVEVFNSDANEGLGFMEKLGAAAATFFVRIFQIPAEFLAGLIPEDIKERAMIAIGDFIDGIMNFFLKTLPNFWQESIVDPLNESLEGIGTWIEEKVGIIFDFLDKYMFEPFSNLFNVFGSAISRFSSNVGEFFTNLIAPFANAVKAFQGADGFLDGLKAASAVLFGGGGGEEEVQTGPKPEYVDPATMGQQFQYGAFDRNTGERVSPTAMALREAKLEKERRERGGGEPSVNVVTQDNSNRTNSTTHQHTNMAVVDYAGGGAGISDMGDF